MSVFDYCYNSPCEHTCESLSDRFNCSCNTGFVRSGLNNTNCSDINECLAKPCPGIQECTNLVGNYSCACPANYTFNATTAKCEGECIWFNCMVNGMPQSCKCFGVIDHIFILWDTLKYISKWLTAKTVLLIIFSLILGVYNLDHIRKLM